MATPAALPGRLAGVRPLTAAGTWAPMPGRPGMESRTVRRNGIDVRYERPVRRPDQPLVASVRRAAAKEQFFRSQPPEVRRRAGLPDVPPPPSRVWTSAAVPWRTGEVLTASAFRQPFYASEADEDAAVEAFEQAAAVIAHGEAGSLPGEPLSEAQDSMVHTYARLMTIGSFESAARVLDTLRGSAARVRRDRMRSAMADLEVRLVGKPAAMTAAGRRQKLARLNRAADQILGPERAGRIRQMRALRRRVDRTVGLVSMLPGAGKPSTSRRSGVVA